MKLSIVSWNRYFSIINCAIYSAFILLFSLWTLNQINHIWGLSLTNETWKNLKIFLVMFCSIGLFFSILLNFSTWSLNQKQFLNFKNQFILMSLISINPLLFSINSSYCLRHKRKERFSNFAIIKKSSQKFKLKRLTIFDITLISVFSSLVVLGNWFEMSVHFLPYGAGGLNIKYLFVMIISFLNSVLSGFITGAVGSLISLLFLGNNLVISPWSYLLDYFLPTITPCIVGFFYFAKPQHNKKLEYLNYVLMVVITYLLIWFWQTLSGYLIWVKIFPPVWGAEKNYLIYSVVFNALSIWLFSYPVTQIFLPIIIRALRPLPWKR